MNTQDHERDEQAVPVVGHQGAAFTPGPWTAFWNEENARLEIGCWRFAHGDGHSALPLLRCKRNNSKAEANARLISAAPDLLAALKLVVANIEDYERVNNLAPNPGRQHCWDSVAQAHAAIAKAEGRS